VKRAAVLVILAAAVTLGIDALGDLTQDRPDRVAPGSRTEIVLEVSNKNHHGSVLESAHALWAVCQTTVHNRLEPPGVVPIGGDHFRLVTAPAVGEHSWRRLQGCLEDLSVDQVLARVISHRDIPAQR
jgi:hypothetical protein